MDINSKCGGCFWYGVVGGTGKLGECKNAQSAFYWNQGDDREAVRISADADSCRDYRSARVFLEGHGRTARSPDVSPIARSRTFLYQLVYPLVLSGVVFYYIFRSGPERSDNAYTRTETEELSL